ncbi:hypothetical protein D3C78_1902070 [compost metagenome]
MRHKDAGQICPGQASLQQQLIDPAGTKPRVNHQCHFSVVHHGGIPGRSARQYRKSYAHIPHYSFDSFVFGLMTSPLIPCT